MIDAKKIKWYYLKDMENLMANIINEIPKNNFKEGYNNTIMCDKFGLVEFDLKKNNILITFKKCKQLYLKNSKETNSCCVCFESCKKVLKCNHHICQSCAYKWVKENNTCPICRANDNFTSGYKFNLPMKALRKILI